MDNFEMQFQAHKTVVDRYVKFKIPSITDAEDLLQDIYFAAFQNYGSLKNKEVFKAWILSIARNKCNNWFRDKAKQLEIPVDELPEIAVVYNNRGRDIVETVRDSMGKLRDKDKQILYLYYWKQIPQSEIAKQLSVPIGTVKSRLHTAKANFKKVYPYHRHNQKGEEKMKYNNCIFPEFMPEYRIEPSPEKPFDVKFEELMAWGIIPKLNEKAAFADYDYPDRRKSLHIELEVTRKAQVHGIEGVQIVAKEYANSTEWMENNKHTMERQFVAQLTDTHCRLLAECHPEDDILKYSTFLDGDSFMNNWGFGEDNCGNETNLSPKSLITEINGVITSENKDFLMDIVGRYNVSICGKIYDTVRLIYLEEYNGNIATETYIDKNGRTILWRRFNKNNWAFNRYGKLWTEMYPDNETITINDETNVHWCDSINDYVLN